MRCPNRSSIEFATLRLARRSIKEVERLTHIREACMIFSMKRQILLRALTLVTSASALILTSCTTTETRIKERPAAYAALSPSDHALVPQGHVRDGMSQAADNNPWVPRR